MTGNAQSLAITATQLAAQGHDAEAAALYDQGLADFPHDAKFVSSAGNFHFKAGRMMQAIALFERALVIDPSFVEAAVNAAITLGRLGQFERAADLLASVEAEASGNPSYWRVRADSERHARRFRLASASMAQAILYDPRNPRTARSRARLALERGDPEATAYIEAALTLNRGDPNLLYDYAQALAIEGRMDEALECTSTLVTHVPTWTDGLKLHAEMRWAAGDREDFDDHFAIATKEPGANQSIWLAWSDTLAGVDRHAQSAAVLEGARRLWREDEALVLAHAIALGEAGSAQQAQHLLERGGTTKSDEWATARGRNWLRLGELVKAESELAAALTSRPINVAAWALTDLCWRQIGDERHHWLHGQVGLVRQIAVPLDAHEWDALTVCLTNLHRNSAMPIGQSVKEGSQTKGALFARMEPELARLENALLEALEEYRNGLSPADARHPLLARRNEPWEIVGSWSIRLNGEGYHAPHIHPSGLLSSASYWLVPVEVDSPSQPGWLELGNPPPGLAPNLGPLHTIRPKPGTLVLFPSTLYHGTRPTTYGTRMTVAFDVSANG